MKLYIAYKFLGSDKDQLKTTLEQISQAIEKTLNSTYIFSRDAQNRGSIQIPENEILPKAFHELDACDALFALVESEEKSEGMLLEIGFAKAKNKKIFLAIKKGIHLRLVRSIADEIIEFDEIGEIEGKIQNIFGHE